MAAITLVRRFALNSTPLGWCVKGVTENVEAVGMEALESVNLAKVAKKAAGTFSGGMKRRKNYPQSGYESFSSLLSSSSLYCRLIAALRSF